MKQAVAVLRGTLAALSKGQLGMGWFEAMAEYPEQVADLEWETNASRMEAALLAGKGRR